MSAEDEPTKLHKRRLMSKYDSVKVYVWIAGCPPHSYVLSRYLIARMLAVAKIPYTKAVKIALRLKKTLVDRDRQNVTQEELETCLCEQLELKQYGMEYFRRLKFVNRFFQQKRRLVITICGAPSIGKSTFAQQLATRFNLPTVVQTDVIYELTRRAPESPLCGSSLFEKMPIDEQAFLREYDRECLIVRRAMEVEINQMVVEEKVLIMEGVHLDPGLYLTEMAQLQAVCYPYGASASSISAMSQVPSNTAMEDDGSSYSHQWNNENADFDAIPPIVYIPVIVTASVQDHRLLAREAIYRTGSRFFSPQTEQNGESVFQKIRRLNDYLIEYPHPNVACVQIGLSDTTEVLDQLHDHFLNCISSSMHA